MSASKPEIDVDVLMGAIREAALKHPPRPIAPLPQPNRTSHHRQLTLSPEFNNPNDNTYHVNDLLKYHDRDFIRNAYRAILKRKPDEAGFRHNLELLQSGVYNKIDILASLRFSDEGKRSGVIIEGLRLPATIRTLERLPVLGYLIQLLIALIRLPSMVRSQREFQGYIVAQQLSIADHVNETQRVANDSAVEQFSILQGQVRAVETSVMAQLLTEQERLQQAEAQLLLLADRLTTASQTLSKTRHELDEHRAVVKNLTMDVKTLTHNVADEQNRSTEETGAWDKFYSAFEE